MVPELEKEINNEYLRRQKTGGDSSANDFKIENIPFDKYVIRVILTPSNEFVGIDEVEINKDFLSFKQKIATKNFHDVEKFYLDE